jgi:YetA-like protein
MISTQPGRASPTLNLQARPSRAESEVARHPRDILVAVTSPFGAAAHQPVTFGLPFPRGHLSNPAHVALLAEDGDETPLQATPLARWPDGSVKWLLLDGVLGPVARGQQAATLRLSQDPATPSLSIHESGARITVDTGAVTFHLDRTALPLLARVSVGGKELLGPGAAQVLLTDAKGRSVAPRINQVAFEARGPVRATLRVEGDFPGRAPCRFVARLCFFAGTGLVRLRLTVHNPRRARHPGGLWDLGDAGSVLFRELALGLRLNTPDQPEVSWTAEAGQLMHSAKANLEIYQDSSGGENWQSRNHVNREGRAPCTFRGYRVRFPGHELSGLRASPVVTLRGANGAVTAAVPEFWQQFPKALEVRDGWLRVGLFPRQFGDLFELQGGEQKTHTVWLHFGAGDAPQAALDWVHHPARVRATPAWYAASEALPYLGAADGPAGALDAYLAEAIAGDRNLLARREVIDEYGWRNYGEVYADHEQAYYRGPQPVVSHYNNQYDLVYGAVVQYLRGGDERWYELLDPLARHVIDIDLYHTDQDKAAYNGGLFWFTDHYTDAATCTHRTYSRANCKPGDRSYGGGPSSSHNFTTGLLHYYYLTGDPLACAAVLDLTDWVVAMDDGTRHVLGLVDDGPTGLASCTGALEYHGPGRGAGNSINALLDAWLLTGRRCYLHQAEVLVRRCVHPADDVAAHDLLNVEKRWSYTVFFVALARYLYLKAEAGELDRMYGYARASLLHYARWMLDHERPYFDHPEQFEFPTETWAAQDLRKANVLRLAAAHADEPLRGRLLRRGQELADRGWQDLLRFESRTVARAVAVVLTEGAVDDFFRSQPVAPAARPREGGPFPDAEAFVPQRRRVLARLKTPRGLLQTALRLANPFRWRRLAS